MGVFFWNSLSHESFLQCYSHESKVANSAMILKSIEEDRLKMYVNCIMLLYSLLQHILFCCILYLQEVYQGHV